MKPPDNNVPFDFEQAALWCLRSAHGLPKDEFDLTHARICLALAHNRLLGIVAAGAAVEKTFDAQIAKLKASLTEPAKGTDHGT